MSGGNALTVLAHYVCAILAMGIVQTGYFVCWLFHLWQDILMPVQDFELKPDVMHGAAVNGMAAPDEEVNPADGYVPLAKG